MTRRPARRLLIGALALSAGLHALLITGVPGWPVSPEPAAEPAPLLARLYPSPEEPRAAAAAPVPAQAAAKPAKPAPRPKHAARATPPPVASAAVPAGTNPAPIDADAATAVAADIAAAPVDGAAAPIDALPAETGEPAAPDRRLSAADAPEASAEDPPAEYPWRRVRLVYDLLHSESQTRIGNVIHTFETDGERYAAEAVGEGVGFVSLFYGGKFVQRSRGVIGPDGLVPEEYTLDRGRGDPPERAVFDWSHGQVDLSWRNERRTVALPEGAQDPISALHQIYFMQPMAMSSQLRIATGRKLGEYTYALLGEADLITPLGLVRTLHVGRVATDGSVLEVWLDRDRELLPVRIYSRDRKGTILDQVVREVALLE